MTVSYLAAGEREREREMSAPRSHGHAARPTEYAILAAPAAKALLRRSPHLIANASAPPPTETHIPSFHYFTPSTHTRSFFMNAICADRCWFSHLIATSTRPLIVPNQTPPHLIGSRLSHRERERVERDCCKSMCGRCNFPFCLSLRVFIMVGM